MPDSIDKLGKSRGERSKSVSSADPRKARSVEIDPVAETEQDRFNDVLKGITDGPAEKRLGLILGDIKRLAGQLAHRRLLEDLEQYREKVGDFLRLYLDEVLSVRETSGRRGVSRRRQLLVVKRVNVELEELSRMVLGGTEDFKILKELDTIEGLLMDLYR
jgi:uncharacterized protein YaaR (DUF327 family)